MNRLILLIIAVCVVLIVTAKAYGQVRSDSDASQVVDFVRCDGRWCFLKIIPGITPWEAVPPRLVSNGIGEVDVEGSTYQVISFVMHGADIELASESASTTDLISIDYRSNNSPPSLGMVLAKYGIPCGVSFYPVQCNTYLHCEGLASVVLFYDSLVVSASLQKPGSQRWVSTEIKQLDPALPVAGLALFNPERFPKTSTSPCHVSFSADEIGSHDTPWLGFTSTQHYLQYNNPPDE